MKNANVLLTYQRLDQVTTPLLSFRVIFGGSRGHLMFPSLANDDLIPSQKAHLNKNKLQG